MERSYIEVKSMYRDRLRKLMEYIKISKLCEEFGLTRNTLSAFLKSSDNDYMISEERLHDLCLFIENRISELVR